MEDFLEKKIDDFFYQITTEVGKGCPGLLDALFGFLYRRTDFFYLMTPEGKMGFPPGVAENMVIKHFKKYQELSYKRNPPDPDINKKWEIYRKQQEEEKKQSKKSNNLKGPNNQIPIPMATTSEKINESKDISIHKSSTKNEDKKREEKNELKKEIPKEEKLSSLNKAIEVDDKMKRISTYNGDVLDNYYWGQTVADVTFQAELPVGTNTKDLDVKITPTIFHAKVKGAKNAIIEGEFYERVKAEDSIWTIEDNKLLTVTLQKQKDLIWSTVFKGDREIDVQKVDNSKTIDQFDNETQGHLQKVLYEQNRMLRGLPTTEEQRNAELMSKVAKMEGSPFFEGNIPYGPKYPEKKE